MLAVLLGPRVRPVSSQLVRHVLVGLMVPRVLPTRPLALWGPRGLGGNHAANLARRMRSNPCLTMLRPTRRETGLMVLLVVPGGVTLPGGLEEAAEMDRPHPEKKTATAIVLGIGTAIGIGIVTVTGIVTVIVTVTAIGAETVEIIATVLPLRSGGATLRR